jgi:hypothetical protein
MERGTALLIGGFISAFTQRDEETEEVEPEWHFFSPTFDLFNKKEQATHLTLLCSA